MVCLANARSVLICRCRTQGIPCCQLGRVPHGRL